MSGHQDWDFSALKSDDVMDVDHSEPGPSVPAPQNQDHDDDNVQSEFYYPNIQRWLQTREGPKPKLDCGICWGGIFHPDIHPPESANTREPLEVLNCLHVLGSRCWAAVCFEAQEQEEEQKPRCPFCRTEFEGWWASIDQVSHLTGSTLVGIPLPAADEPVEDMDEDDDDPEDDDYLSDVAEYGTDEDMEYETDDDPEDDDEEGPRGAELLLEPAQAVQLQENEAMAERRRRERTLATHRRFAWMLREAAEHGVPTAARVLEQIQAEVRASFGHELFPGEE